MARRGEIVRCASTPLTEAIDSNRDDLGATREITWPKKRDHPSP